MAPPIVILLLAGFSVFLWLSLGARKDPERQKQFYLFAAIAIWLACVFI